MFDSLAGRAGPGRANQPAAADYFVCILCMVCVSFYVCCVCFDVARRSAWFIVGRPAVGLIYFGATGGRLNLFWAGRRSAWCILSRPAVGLVCFGATGGRLNLV